MCRRSFFSLLAALLLLLGFIATSEARAPKSVLTSAPVTTAVMQRLQDVYLDPSRFDYQQGLQDALQAIEAVIPEFQVDYKPGDPTLQAQMHLARKTFTVDYVNSIPATLDVLKKVYRFIQQNLGDDIDPADVEYAAANGFLTILDPHTRLLPPDIYKQFMVTTSGAFGGIGIVIGLRENQLTVVSPLDDTPAARAGVRAGDRITRIEDESTENMPLDDAVKRLRGPEGTVVHLSIMRKGLSSPMEVALTRARIEVPSVESDLLPDNVGYVRITSFQEQTARDLADHLARLQSQSGGIDNFKGLVLDLRNNPGGLLDQAIQVSDIFLEEGTIVSTVTRTNRKPEKAKRFQTEKNYPIAVLTNEGSASASEIVAGALKNHGRAIVVGARTFGKGSVQNIFELPLGAALKITVAQYLTAGDQSIQSVGVAPNVQLVPVEVSRNEVHMTMSEPSGHEEKGDFHLEGIVTSHARPEETLSYLVEVEDEPAKDAEPDPEAEKERYNGKIHVDLDKDYPSAIARRIILGTAGPSRQIMLESNKDLIARERDEQLKTISTALKKRGNDWTGGATVLPVTMDVDVDVVNEAGKKTPAARAGEKQFIQVKVTNGGKNTLYRLHAVTDSEEPFLDEREFVFGRVAPGATATERIPFDIAKSAVGRTSGVNFKFSVDDGVEVTKVERPVKIEALPRPNFTVSYKLVDTPRTGIPAQGNGDGQINPGEIISLDVTVKNVGKGKSEGSTFRLRSLGGPLIDITEGAGTTKIRSLAPGEEGTGTVSFEIKPTYLEDTIPLEFSIVDGELAAGFSQKMDLVVVRQGGVVPSLAAIDRTRSRVFAPPLLSVQSETLAGIENPAAEVNLRGDIRDDVRVKDFYVAVNGEKTYYRSYEGAAAERLDRFNFNVKLDLKAGSNFVLLVTRDGDDLVTRYPLYIWHPSPASAVGEAAEPAAKKKRPVHP